MPRIVLASQSPRRRVLLRFLVPEFDVRPMDVTEQAPHALAIADALEVIARKKAIAASRDDREAWVIGADTVVSFRGELLGKPRSPGEARLHLAMLSGQTHEVTTGVALAHGGQSVEADSVTTRVRMDLLDVDLLDRYVRSEAWAGKAGGYGIQDPELAPHTHVDGPWSNVVGLPLAATARLLQGNGLPCQEPPDEAWLRDHNPFETTAD